MYTKLHQQIKYQDCESAVTECVIPGCRFCVWWKALNQVVTDVRSDLTNPNPDCYEIVIFGTSCSQVFSLDEINTVLNSSTR